MNAFHYSFILLYLYLGIFLGVIRYIQSENTYISRTETAWLLISHTLFWIIVIPVSAFLGAWRKWRELNEYKNQSGGNNGNKT